MAANDRRWSSPAACIALAALYLTATASPALALNARLRWRPSGDARVTGYNVYVRQARAPYSSALDARMPARAADGTMTFTVPNLVNGRAYHFAVTAYLGDRTESVLSSELALGTMDPCSTDRCATRTNCDFTPKPDGAPCAAASCDVCRAGACARGTDLALDSRTFRLSGRTRSPAVAASGSFVPSRPIDPTRTGMTIEVADAGGRTLHRTQLPAAAFKKLETGTVFRLRNRVEGVRHLNLRVVDGIASISAELEDEALDPAFDLPRLAWGLRLGSDACASDGPLVCSGGVSASSCR
jgi:hypothetical protein